MHPLPYSLPSTPLQIDGRLNFNITAAASKLYHTAAEEKALSGVLHLLVVQDLHGPISSAEELQLERSAAAGEECMRLPPRLGQDHSGHRAVYGSMRAVWGGDRLWGSVAHATCRAGMRERTGQFQQSNVFLFDYHVDSSGLNHAVFSRRACNPFDSDTWRPRLIQAAIKRL